jgi:Domain of unknown function (DUF4145)
MPFESGRWIERLHASYAPNWPCPRCRNGVLRLNRDSVCIVETSQSRLNSDYPGDTEKRFSLMLICDQQPCREPVAVLGYTDADVTYDSSDGSNAWEDRLVPTSIFPALDLFPLLPKYPPLIREELKRSFLLFWCDLRACANSIRTVVELVLDSRGVKRKARTKAGELRDLSLHARIKVFAERETEIGEAMLALKWLGNEGSHPGELKRSDLLEAFEILCHALEEIFLEHRRRVTKLVRDINRQKGPRRAKRRKRGI